MDAIDEDEIEEIISVEIIVEIEDGEEEDEEKE